MVLYAAGFLAFILVGVPYVFHVLGNAVLPETVHAWIAPASTTQQALGVVLFIFGLIAYLVSSLWLVIVGKGPFVEFDPPTRFVASGPYRWMRNPIAAALLITVLGEAVFFGSAGILSLFLLGIPLAQLQVTRIEEPRLRKRFGESYIEYCRHVPRWLPRRPKGPSAAS
jgi:protein-S-isoprenylcysteine O-methyltransferase Ste14